MTMHLLLRYIVALAVVVMEVVGGGDVGAAFGVVAFENFGRP